MKLWKNPSHCFPIHLRKLSWKSLKTFLAVALLGDSKNILNGFSKDLREISGLELHKWVRFFGSESRATRMSCSTFDPKKITYLRQMKKEIIVCRE